MNRLRTQPRLLNSRGFTLLELVLVLMIFAIILGIAAPSLRGFWAGRRTRDAAEDILSLAQFARSRAASDACIYRLNIDSSSGTYVMTMQQGQEFIPTGTSFGQPSRLPDGVRIELSRQQPGDGEFIDFYPDGRTDVATIRIVDPEGLVTVILCPSPAEPFRILSPEEAARI